MLARFGTLRKRLFRHLRDPVDAGDSAPARILTTPYITAPKLSSPHRSMARLTTHGRTAPMFDCRGQRPDSLPCQSRADRAKPRLSMPWPARPWRYDVCLTGTAPSLASLPIRALPGLSQPNASRPRHAAGSRLTSPRPTWPWRISCSRVCRRQRSGSLPDPALHCHGLPVPA